LGEVSPFGNIQSEANTLVGGAGNDTYNILLGGRDVVIEGVNGGLADEVVLIGIGVDNINDPQSPLNLTYDLAANVENVRAISSMSGTIGFTSFHVNGNALNNIIEKVQTPSEVLMVTMP
jgi:Ca2+-binding RTX toxin-like protein